MKTQTENRKLRISLWLVNQFRMHTEGFTIDELNEKYVANTDLSMGEPMPKRTFYDYKQAILDIFGIDIVCNRRSNRYRIDLEDENELTRWLLNSFSVGQLVQEQQDVRDCILLEQTPAGMRFFNRVIESLRTHVALRLTYQKFADDEPYLCTVHPYAVKLDQGRWYMIARKDGRDHLQSFAFDRFHDLHIIEGEHYELEIPFNPQSYFANSFGIFTNPPAEKVVIRVYGNTYNYLHTKPLHSSQQERFVGGSGDSRVWEFSYIICPSIDFKNELLRWGAGIEVIEPGHFRQQVAEETRRMMDLYKKQ